jgi:hypothetical protein
MGHRSFNNFGQICGYASCTAVVRRLHLELGAISDSGDWNLLRSSQALVDCVLARYCCVVRVLLIVVVLALSRK